MIGGLFTRLEQCDEQERAHTFDFLKLAINEGRWRLMALTRINNFLYLK